LLRPSTRSKESTWHLLTIVTLSALITLVGIESWKSISISFQLNIHLTTFSSSIRVSWAWDRWTQPQTFQLCTSHWSRHQVWTWLRDRFCLICSALAYGPVLGVAARRQVDSGRRNGLQVGVQVANNRAQKAKLKTGEQLSEGSSRCCNKTSFSSKLSCNKNLLQQQTRIGN